MIGVEVLYKLDNCEVELYKLDNCEVELYNILQISIREKTRILYLLRPFHWLAFTTL